MNQELKTAYDLLGIPENLQKAFWDHWDYALKTKEGQWYCFKRAKLTSAGTIMLFEKSTEGAWDMVDAIQCNDKGVELRLKDVVCVLDYCS